MNGLKYILFVKELSLKEVADQVGVVPQLIAAWSNGVRKIPEHHIRTLSSYLRVEPDLIVKDLLLEDKIKIEMQLGLPGSHQFQQSQELELYQRHETLKERYSQILALLRESEAENHSLQRKLNQIKTFLD